MAGRLTQYAKTLEGHYRAHEAAKLPGTHFYDVSEALGRGVLLNQDASDRAFRAELDAVNAEVIA